MSNVVKQIEDFIQTDCLDEARKLVYAELDKEKLLDEKWALFYSIKLYSFLIDIGSLIGNQGDLELSIQFYEANKDQILTCIDKASYYYNLANARHGLIRVYTMQKPGVRAINEFKELFHDPIRLYWLAYKNWSGRGENFLLQILINLSNSLIDAGRVIEGIQFLDIALRAAPNFPQALISRGDGLTWLKQITNCSVSVSLYAEIFKSYEKGLNSGLVPEVIKGRVINSQGDALKRIQEFGFDLDHIEEEVQQSQVEFRNHSDFRRYCIENFLTLNEHGIYCNCAVTRLDDLCIGVTHAIFKGKVAELELLLNRMKSEFAISRWSYYQSLQSETPVEFDMGFSELLDGELINGNTELQRTAFRLCYSILDKIALGICKLYALDSKKIYFESFWAEKKRNQKLNSVRNIHLNALYSIACDLSGSDGELSHFKKWRNDLEHNFIVIKNTSSADMDLLNVFSDKEFVEVIDADEFRSKTLHLLQLTRAAILSFVYCVRLETIEEKSDEKVKKAFTIEFK